MHVELFLPDLKSRLMSSFSPSFLSCFRSTKAAGTPCTPSPNAPSTTRQSTRKEVSGKKAKFVCCYSMSLCQLCTWCVWCLRACMCLPKTVCVVWVILVSSHGQQVTNTSCLSHQLHLCFSIVFILFLLLLIPLLLSEGHVSDCHVDVSVLLFIS